jgi:hypothetical protein
VGTGGPLDCAGNLAQTAFRWALCSCTNVDVSAPLTTDAYDSSTGPYAAGGKGGGVGLDGTYAASQVVTVGGVLWSSAAAGITASQNTSVGLDVHSGGNISTTKPFTVAGNGYVVGTVSAGVTFGGTLTHPTSVAAPCDCSASQLIPVASIVSAHAGNNDDALIGLNPTVFANGAPQPRLDLPCGNYYLTKINTSTPLTIMAHGRTALYVDGDVTPSSFLSISVAAGGELDIFIKGTLTSSQTLVIGSTAYPAATRLYLGGTTSLKFSSTARIGANIYAGTELVDWSGNSDIYGSVFAGSYKSSQVTNIHYDRAVLRSGVECPPLTSQTCSSCRDCANQACNGGTCGGGCTDNSQCCAPLFCNAGTCQALPGAPPTCAPKTCASYPAGTCGVQGDGCGGVTASSCGSCTTPGQTCGGGGVANRCGAPAACAPKTCADLGAQCGTLPDGCGSTVTCPSCTAPATCGGGGVAYKCGTPTCSPKSCPQLGVECGLTGDGCGNPLTCTACPTGLTCGGGGVPNQCGAPSCTPLAACPAGKNCGDMPDGCGGVVHCGDCAASLTCGGGGAPNVCGAASCSPKTCAQLGAVCGSASDRCGGVLPCGTCPDGDFCNGQNVCVPPVCVPKTCAELGVECGPTSDTCGGLVECGGCPSGQGCGAGGQPGKCGTNPCIPKTCAQLGAVCGQVADGCGGLTPDCGTCSGALSCKNGACVAGCTPRTCATANAQCGPISDGCGSLVDCGPCPPGQECGYKNIPNTCGSDAPK